MLYQSVSIDIMGRIDKWHLLPCLCRYFDKILQKCSLNSFCIKHIIVYHFYWLPWKRKCTNSKMPEIIIMLYEADNIEIVIILAFTDFMFSIVIAHRTC